MIRILTCLLFIQTQLLAQTDSNFISQHPYDATLYSYLTSKINTIEYYTVKSKYTLRYQPNSLGSFGIGGSYKWVDLSLGILSYGKQDNNKYGTTTRFDVQSHLYPRKFIFDIFFQLYNGFYSVNKEIIPKGAKSYYRNDIGMSQLGINIIRILNYEQFSTKAAFSQSEIQRKKAGSWAVGTKFNIFGINSDSSLLAQNIDSLYLSDYRIKQFSVLQIGILGGYLYNWLYKNWLFNVSAMAGLASQLQFKELSSQIGKIYPHSTIGGIVNVRFGIGYNKERSYFYVSASSDNCNYPLSSDYQLKHTFGRIDVCYGYRLLKTKNTKY